MDFKRELIYDFLDDLLLLADQHKAEVSNVARPLSPRWDRYAALEQSGHLVCFTVRSEKDFAGYACFFIDADIHHETQVNAICDLLYFKPEYRNGFAFKRFIRFIEAELKPLADRISFNIKIKKDFRPLLYPLGYVDDEVIVTKSL